MTVESSSNVQGKPRPVGGIALVDKPAGWTSHDVVAKMRRITGVHRIGHSGTLDPMATGLLTLGIGHGTRILEYLLDADKQYEATIQLGVTTDTYDADGQMTGRYPTEGITVEGVKVALSQFCGQIIQRPPAYSALKLAGVPAYRHARAGAAVELPPRVVTVASLDLIGAELPHLRVRVRCSKGTYIRSIAHDLGTVLGCGGHLVSLRRTATAGLLLTGALPLSEWQRLGEEGSWARHLIAVDTALAHLPSIVVSAAAATRLRVGDASGLGGIAPSAEPTRVNDADGCLLAILRWDADRARWRAEKVLAAN